MLILLLTKYSIFFRFLKRLEKVHVNYIFFCSKETSHDASFYISNFHLLGDHNSINRIINKYLDKSINHLNIKIKKLDGS